MYQNSNHQKHFMTKRKTNENVKTVTQSLKEFV